MAIVGMAVAPSAVALAQAPPGHAGATAFVDDPCAPPPEALIKRRAAIGEPPPPSETDLTVYRQYVQYQQANDWADLCRYRRENHQLAIGARPRVVLIGDSITENWKQRDPEMFKHGIIDRGVGGQTSPQIAARFYQDVIALNPRSVHIMAGTNDMAGNTGPTTDEQFQNNIKMMVDLARAHGIKVILASLLPSKAFYWRPELRPAQKIRALNLWLRTYAQAMGLVFVDYYPSLCAADGGLRPDLSADGVHPSQAGYAVMEVEFKAALAQAERR